MAIGDHELLGRAARALRAAPEPGWQTLEPMVLAAVRATPRGGWPLDVVDPRPGSAPGVIRVSDLVLSAHLGRALRGDPSYVVTDIAIDSEGTALHRIRIDLSGRYGADLHALTAQARTMAAAVVADVTGFEADIVVTVVDVHR